MELSSNGRHKLIHLTFGSRKDWASYSKDKFVICPPNGTEFVNQITSVINTYAKFIVEKILVAIVVVPNVYKMFAFYVSHSTLLIFEHFKVIEYINQKACILISYF